LPRTGSALAAKASAATPATAQSGRSSGTAIAARQKGSSVSTSALNTICAFNTCGVCESCTMRSGCRRVNSAFQKPM
jgi:hypothetical protein